MAIYIEVKVIAPTNVKGKRVSCSAEGYPRQYFPWDYSADTPRNLEASARVYCHRLLVLAGYIMDDIACLTEYRSVKSGIPVGYVWE